MITLKNRHIIIDKKIVEKLFAQAAQVCWVYYAVKNTLLIASQHDDLFKSLHKTAMSMLKFKNSMGDRSISIEELLLDNDIDGSERPLNYMADETMKILTISF
ncbi:MAG: hypothetical protein ORN85_02230 [Sediminibacterium sp.]|nr:hypothetical protein [Sediminibacterium sp.]